VSRIIYYFLGLLREIIKTAFLKPNFGTSSSYVKLNCIAGRCDKKELAALEKPSGVGRENS
jgi:hypothetical protein